MKGAAGASGEDAKRGTQQFARVPEGVVTGAVHFAEAAVGVVNGGGGAVAVAKLCGGELAQGVGRREGVVVVAEQPVGVEVRESRRHAEGEATGATGVLRVQDEVQARVIALFQPFARAVGRGVIHDDHARKRLRQRRRQCLQQRVTAVVGDDDGDDVHQMSQ